MGANISIKEGGKGRGFTAQRLRTLQSGGGTVDWVPESETRTKTLYANENGTYAPAAEGVYAFDEVRVNVPELDSFTGTGDDGNEYHYHKKGGGGGGGGGGEDEEIELDKLPSRIKVTVEPNNLVYNDGEKIDFTGLEVTGYDKNNFPMDVIPREDLTFIETIAEYDESMTTDVAVDKTHTIDIPQPVIITDNVVVKYHFSQQPEYVISYQVYGGYMVLVSTSKSNPLYYQMYAFSKEGVPEILEISEGKSEVISNLNYESITYFGLVPFHYSTGAVASVDLSVHELISGKVYDVDPSTDNIVKKIGTVMFDGKVYKDVCPQKIHVEYTRPGDGKVLETSFYIFVTEPDTPSDEVTP